MNADDSAPRSDRKTRRELAVRSLTLGAAAAGATGMPLILPLAAAAVESKSDTRILTGAVMLEHQAAATYDAIVKATRDARLSGLAHAFGAHAQEHADAFASILLQREIAPPPPPRSAAIKRANRLSDGAAIELAISLEGAAVRFYYDAMRNIEDGGLVKIGAATMANHGQHLALLRGAANREPVPTAFEAGGRARS